MMKERWSYGIFPAILFFLRVKLVRTEHLLMFRSCKSSTTLLSNFDNKIDEITSFFFCLDLVFQVLLFWDMTEFSCGYEFLD